MIVLFATVFSFLAINAEARFNPKLRVFEVHLEPESPERVEEPVLTRIQDLPSSRTEAGRLTRQLVKQIDHLLNTQNERSTEDESEEFVDETRSSLVLVPADSEHFYEIVRDVKKKPGGSKKLIKPFHIPIKWGIPNVSKYDDRDVGSGRFKRAIGDQWEVPIPLK